MRTGARAVPGVLDGIEDMTCDCGGLAFPVNRVGWIVAYLCRACQRQFGHVVEAIDAAR